MDKRQRARELYENEGLTLAETARKLGISYSTVRSWKHRDRLNGSQWTDNFKTRKRCMAKPQLDNLVLFKRDNMESFKHGLYSDRLSPEAQELFNAEFKDTASNPFTKSIAIEFCRYVCSGKGLDYRHPTGLIAESRQARKLSKMISSYIEIKGTVRDLFRLEEMRTSLEPEKQDKVAKIIDFEINEKLNRAMQQFPEAEALLKVA